MLARTPAPWTSRTGPFAGALASPRTWIRLQLEPVTRGERDDASFVTCVGVVRIGDDHGAKTRMRVADFQLVLV